MNLKQLRLVREIIRNDFNVTEAAASLYTSQSGVSKHIKDLEDELGIALFIRRGKRLLGLTEPGAEVVKVMDRLLLEADNVKRVASHFADSSRGTLTIATTHTQGRYALPSVLSLFRERFPHVTLVLLQAHPREIPKLLIEGQAEVGMSTDTLDDVPDLLAFPYYSWRHAVIVPEGHPLTQTQELTLERIAEYPIVTYDHGLTGRRQIDKAFENRGLTANISMAALDSDVIKTYVALGFGVGIIAQMAYDKVQDRGLRLIDKPEFFETNTTSIAVRRGRFLRSYVYRLIEMCTPDISEDIIRAAESESDATGEAA